MWNSRPPPFMEKTILNFHFDYWNPSLSSCAGGILSETQPTNNVCLYNDQLAWQKTNNINRFSWVWGSQPQGPCHCRCRSSHLHFSSRWGIRLRRFFIRNDHNTLRELRVEDIWSPTTACIVFFITRIVPLLVSKDSAENSLSTWWDHHEIRNLRIIG